MSQKWLDHIIDKVSEEQKELASKSAFDTSVLPSKVVGRTNEVEDLVRYLWGFNEGHVVPLVSIFGRSGTGKSALVRYVCNHIPKVKLCFVNLRKAKTVFGGVNLILNALDQPSLKSAQGMNVAMEKIQQEILNLYDKKIKLVVLALDEFDVLFYDKRGNPSDFVYKLVEMQSEIKENGHLFMIITISNNVLADYDLDDRIRSRIGNSEIFFRPYLKETILEILEIRAKDAFAKVIDHKVLEYCANHSVLEHGDARRAVDLLRVASEIATQKKEELSIPHIKAASQILQKDRVEDTISTLSYHSRMALLALAKKTYGLDRQWHSTASLFEGYKKLLDTDPVTYRRFSELLKDLDNTGLLDSDKRSHGQKGYKREYTLLVLPEMVGNAIDKDWWKKNVVDKKKSLELPFGTQPPKNGPFYKKYLEAKKIQDESW